MEQAEMAKTFPQNREVIHNRSQNLRQKLQTFLSVIRKIVDNFVQVYNGGQNAT